jgi:hypothetical protein
MPFAKGNCKGRPAGEPAAHGTARMYRQGCRCEDCRAAYAVVQRDRRARMKRYEGDFTVSAELAREHILELRAQHVGKRAIMDCTGISDVVIMEIANGKRRRIRESTERRIMRVTVDGRAGGSLIPAKQTKRRIDELISAGYTRADLARKLGYKCAELQFRGSKSITAHNAMRIERLHKLLIPSEGYSRVDRMVSLATHSSRRVA